MVGTTGVALTVCTLPDQLTHDPLGPGKMELGFKIMRGMHTLIRDAKTPKHEFFLCGSIDSAGC